ncbi:MAG: hypothetical protein KC414_12495, partial [Romboutsia sp.]|nr:hypothetical protein [Romboutsia sp.]
MHDNPMATDGFEFVEFSGPSALSLTKLFNSLGFKAAAKHKEQDVTIFRQNNINFILNTQQNSFAENFHKKHGASACGMAFRVKDAKYAFERAVSLGAKPYTESTEHIGDNIPAIYGIGDSLLYLIDQYHDDLVYKSKFNFFEIKKQQNNPNLLWIDHLTHNLYKGNMDTWADYYIKLFNFREI